MKITLILVVYVILSPKWSLKSLFLTKKGVKIQKIQKDPLDNLEVQLVSKFKLNRMKIAAFRCCDEQTYYKRHTFQTPFLQNSLNHPLHKT